jgi:hypothetical protein
MQTLKVSRLSQMIASWTRFWFAPSDPTVLAAIRIATGVIVCYTLFAYSFDLQELMGANSWMDLDLRAKMYREGPVPAMSFDWNETLPPPRPPETPEERAYAQYYQLKYGALPPLPYPKSQEDIEKIDRYMADWGVDPRKLSDKGRPVFSVWFHVTDPTAMALIHGGFIVCAFLFTIGYGTRVTAALTWFSTLGYIHRAPASLFGADTMMNVLMMYLTLGPSGAALSVDRLIVIWQAKRRGLPPPPVAPMVSANLVTRLIQIHICIIYLSAGLSKLLGQMWWQGLAPWGAIANFEYSPMNSRLYVGALRELAKNRLVFETAMTAVTVVTIGFEVAYAFVIWRPSLRTPMLWLAVAMHAGIGLFMGLKTFAALMLAFNIAFIAPETIRWAVEWLLPVSWRAKHGSEPQKKSGEAPPAIVRQDTTAKQTVAAIRAKNRR